MQHLQQQPAMPPTIIEVTSPWTRQATERGPNNPSGRGTTGLSRGRGR
jgi:hypothetical protein